MILCSVPPLNFIAPLWKMRRHYVARHLVRSGASLIESQEILGHKRATTTDNYLRTYAPDHGRLDSLFDGQFTQETRKKLSEG